LGFKFIQAGNVNFTFTKDIPLHYYLPVKQRKKYSEIADYVEDVILTYEVVGRGDE